MAGEEYDERTEQERGSGGGKGWVMLGGLALVIVVAAGVAYLALGAAGPDGSGGAGTESASSGTGPGEALPPPTLGGEDAPVTMVEYSDFQCPYCGQFAREVEPELIEQYVKDGTLKIEWRDFPSFGQESVNAALAAREAQEQGRFWEYHEVLYENQGSMNSGVFSDDNLVGYAKEAGVDPEKLEESLTSSELEPAVSRDFEKGQSLGITGTPTFIINGRTVVGAQPKEKFEQVIEKAAAEAGAGSGD